VLGNAPRYDVYLLVQSLICGLDSVMDWKTCLLDTLDHTAQVWSNVLKLAESTESGERSYRLLLIAECHYQLGDCEASLRVLDEIDSIEAEVVGRVLLLRWQNTRAQEDVEKYDAWIKKCKRDLSSELGRF